MRAALYARVSTIQQTDKDSIPAQVDALKKYAEEHNYEIQDIYIDDGISGSLLAERDELQRLLSNVEAGNIDIILVCKLDRWFRSVKHYMTVQEILDKHSVPLKTIWESYETVSPTGRLMVTQMLAFAEYECANTSLRINKTFDYKRQNREILSGKIPYGYKIQDKHLVIDPEKADIVRRVFQTYISTGGVSETLRRTEGLGLPRTQRAIKLLLQNRKYIGECYGIENYHDAIIDKDTFALVQKLLKKNVRQTKFRTYIFSGLCTCSDCGRRLVGTTDKIKPKNERYKVYRCMGHYRAIQDCINSKSLNEKKLEKYLVENLKELAFADISVKDKRKATNYEKKIASTEKKISRLKELYLNELITLDDYKHDLAAYKADIDTFKAEARKYKGTDKKALCDLVGRNLADWYWTLTEDERRVIWRSVIDKIYFDNDKNIKIVFR
jgi:DNA invertase Pin-like site-specific DNA recombinase